jgi:hypothetical protein
MELLARLRWVVVVTVVGSLVGFLGSILIQPRYTARAVIEGQRTTPDVPFDNNASEKLATYLEQVLSLKNVRPLIEREGIARPEEVGKLYEGMVKNTKLQPALYDSKASTFGMVDLISTDSTPQRAEELCAVLTEAILEKTRTDHETALAATTSFLQQQLQEADQHLQETHKQMLKRPSDQEVAREFQRAQESYKDLADLAVRSGVKIPAREKAADIYAEIYIGGDFHPPGAGVLLPCSTGTRDFSPSILYAEIGSGVGLLVGVVLILARRKSPHRIAEPHC